MGAGPAAGGVQPSAMTLPVTDAANAVGICGAPEHAVGNVSVTEFDEPLAPAALVARTAKV